MAGSILTPQTISREALKILEQEMEMRELNQVFSLVEVTLKDGTVLDPIMLELRPRDIDMVAETIRENHRVVVLSNDNESLLIPVADIKHIKALRVTSKEK